jgi:two-component system, NarL family, sensor kinase
MKKILFLIICFCNCTLAQNSAQIELLIKKFDNNKNSNLDSAFIYINKAMRYSESSKNDFLLATCYFKLGYYYYCKNNFDLDKKYILKSINLSKKTKNYKTLSSCYNHLGVLEINNGNYELSMKFLIYSIKIAEQNKLPENKCYALNNMGNLYDLQNNSTKAIEYFKLSEQISLENNFEENLIYVYPCIAALLQKSDKKSALNYYNKSLSLAKKLNNNQIHFSILINLSVFYLHEKEIHSNTKILNYLNQAKTLALKMKSPTNLFYVYFNIGGYYYKIEKFDLALENYNKALELAPQIGDKEQTLNIYKALGDTYKIDKQFEKAIRFQEKYHGLKDSVFNLDKNKAFNEIQTKYEVEKKNLKINLLSKEKLIESNKKRNIIYIGLAILFPLILLLLFYKNRIKLQKIINEKENKLFVQEKQKLQQEQEIKRILGVVQGQDEERNRIAQEIHDGVGGTLAGVKLNLSQINGIIKNEKIDVVVNQLGGLFQELRSISHNLSSNFIKNKNFSDLLFDLKVEYESRKEFEIELTIYPENGFESISENLKHQIYRIVQELLTNISKHAKAKNVAISLTNHNQSLNLIIEDDGIGFDVKSTKGIGLKNIDERLKTIKGEMKIESTLKKGSSFIIDIEI